ncbi:MAG: OsmC family protein [Rhodothermales bacterium]|nr:OsmC family protein [Rhodothermales bacterium]MBO6781356.1 OsmC family protein [Rhodothermales bacterium]
MKPVRSRVERGHYETRVTTRHHRLVADEPKELGGSDLGPTPYELLAAALGTCTAITLRMYADRKGWPLDAVDVRVDHQKIHARDCDCETTATGRIDLMRRDIVLEGALEADQRARLLEIADKCPVHRTLEGEIVVTTNLLEQLD